MWWDWWDKTDSLIITTCSFVSILFQKPILISFQPTINQTTNITSLIRCMLVEWSSWIQFISHQSSTGWLVVWSSRSDQYKPVIDRTFYALITRWLLVDDDDHKWQSTDWSWSQSFIQSADLYLTLKLNHCQSIKHHHFLFY